MSFWNDLSPVVKGAIAVGVLLLVGVLAFTGLSDPTGEETVQERGVAAQ